MNGRAFVFLIIVMVIVFLLACGEDKGGSPVASLICGGTSLPVGCDGTEPTILDGGTLACPGGCAITSNPCSEMFMPLSPPACEGVDCLHITICPCDGSPCTNHWDQS